ncbi:MAG: site-specific DNA-methyltransferase [Alphaproteobacteria bacterium]
MSTKKKATDSLKVGTLPEYQLVDIQKLKPYANNAKKHPPKQVEQIAGSMQQFGVISPLITDSSFEIIAGHGRYEAAKLLGLKQVPVILIDHLSQAEKKAYRLADNQLTLNTGYDDGLLKIEIIDLMGMDLDFDPEVMGFDTATLDIIIDGDEIIENDPADDVPAIPEDEPTVTKLGDIWIMGKHRLICANSLEEQSYKELLLTETAHMIFTDPPYNVSVNGHICGKGKIKHDEFAMASGEMSEEEFIKFLITFIALVIQHSRDGSLHYICMDWRHIFELLSAGRAHYTDLKNICVWNKDNGGMGSFYRSKHELVAVFKHGSKPHLNTVELGKHGRYRTNVWDYRGVNGFAGQSDLEMHPTVKPVAMIVDAIKDCTRRNHIVLDPFAGSGSTLIACEKSGRQARCIELEPKYCDVIVRRWQELTGLDAVHAETGKAFNETQQGGQNDE